MASVWIMTIMICLPRQLGGDVFSSVPSLVEGEC